MFRAVRTKRFLFSPTYNTGSLCKLDIQILTKRNIHRQQQQTPRALDTRLEISEPRPQRKQNTDGQAIATNNDDQKQLILLPPENCKAKALPLGKTSRQIRRGSARVWEPLSKGLRLGIYGFWRW